MDISLFMSASRPKWWERMYESLEGNKCEWEIIAVGPNKPKWHLPYNFRYLRMNYKPCQCYAIASWMCAESMSMMLHKSRVASVQWIGPS